MTPTVSQVRSALPPFRNEKVLITQYQGTKDIIREVINTHGMYETDYDLIYPLFDTGNTYNTCEKIWNFLKYNLSYREESGDEQSTKSPAAILQPGEAIDCKHYALFAGGILDAIKQNERDPFTWCYRFATDKAGKREATHVFVVVTDNGREIWIDPCMVTFNYKKHWNYFEDHQTMALVRISGASTPEVLTPVTVNPAIAWVSFLSMISNNLMGIKQLLISNPQVTKTALKDYCLSKGFDYNQLLNFLAS